MIRKLPGKPCLSLRLKPSQKLLIVKKLVRKRMAKMAVWLWMGPA